MVVLQREAEEDKCDKVMSEDDTGETGNCFWFYDEPCCVCYDIPDKGYGDCDWVYNIKETCGLERGWEGEV